MESMPQMPAEPVLCGFAYHRQASGKSDPSLRALMLI